MQVQLALPLGLTETPEEIFWRVYNEMRVKSRRALDVSEAVVAWRTSGTSIGILRVRNSRLEVALSEALKDAPHEIVEALAEILLAKLFRRRVPQEYRERYKTWLHHAETRARLDSLRKRRGFKRIDRSAGRHYSLDSIFDNVNAEYFNGNIPKPKLAWSTSSSRTHLGHWDPIHQTIVLSRALDSPEVPGLVVTYVMYHEVLHMVYPVEHRGNRRRIHTATFKAAEKRFAGFDEANAFLRRFSSGLLAF